MSYVKRKANQILKNYTHWKNKDGGIYVYDNDEYEDNPNYYENESDFLRWHGYSTKTKHTRKKELRQKEINNHRKPF